MEEAERLCACACMLHLVRKRGAPLGPVLSPLSASSIVYLMRSSLGLFHSSLEDTRERENYARELREEREQSERAQRKGRASKEHHPPDIFPRKYPTQTRSRPA